MFEGFETRMLDGHGAALSARIGGSGRPLVLLHGFPETHLMWRDVAPLLAERFTVICPDLRGYGGSFCPPSAPDHAPYSKRAMALDIVHAVERLGFARFMIAGHDRGGRVAYRAALDHSDKIAKLAALEVIPTAAAWDRADARLALGFWPWSLLAQPSPLPERLIGAAPEAVIEDAVGQWGSSDDAFPPEVRTAYAEALRSAPHLHAICEEYRAAAGIDREHDAVDRAENRRIPCSLLALWSRKGGLETWYEQEGGPLGIWRQWADHVEGEAVDGGHFFPEEFPRETATRLAAFFSAPDPDDPAR